MRVLHIGKFFPPPFGGMETVLVQLCEQLAPLVATDVLVAHSRPRYETFRRDGYTVHKVPSLGTLAGTSICPSMPLWARRLFAQRQYDLVHLHFPNPTAHLAVAALPKSVPLVISWHSDVIRQQRLLRLYRPFLNRIVARAAAVVGATPKHFSSSSQLQRCPAHRRFVVPYAIDAERFRITPHAQRLAEAVRRRCAGERLIFAVGRHVSYKGFEYLIRALPQVAGSRLLLGGDGPLTPQLQTVARVCGVAERVTFLGRIPAADLPAYYSAADVFCLPSVTRNEAFGMVQLEAMLCRRPVVCCELHNGVSAVNLDGVTGLVVPPRDPHALAAALNRLLCDARLRQRMGAAGHARAVREFSAEKMREGMLAVYRAVLDHRRAGGAMRRAA